MGCSHSPLTQRSPKASKRTRSPRSHPILGLTCRRRPAIVARIQTDAVDHMAVQVITTREPSWIEPFTRLSPAQFRKLVRTVAARGGDEIADGRPGRPWSLKWADRVLLVAAYWRTNLTMRQIGPLFGESHSVAHRVIDSLGPLLTLAPVRRRRSDQIAIENGTLVLLRDHRLAAPSKNCRYSANLQIAIDADTRLVIALGTPKPGNRNDCTAYRDSGINTVLAGRPVLADGGYRGNPELIMPFRRPGGGQELPEWKTAVNTSHKRVRARVEHSLSRLKCWKILRDYRRAAATLQDTASGIANLHNIALGH